MGRKDAEADRPTQPPDGAPGAPCWITTELIEATIRVWQPFYKNPLTRADALEILQRVGHLIDVLEDP
jgi:hypothetical protein